MVPRQQLTVGKGKAGGLPGKSFGQFRRGGGTKEKLLQQDVFSRTLDPAGFDVRTAGRTKPMSGRDRTELHAFQVERCVTTVANNTGRLFSGEGIFAGSAGGSF
jgi:hypothetical protein